MNGHLVQMQVFYEISMDIAVEADLGATARKGLSSYLHRLGCMAGAILRADFDKGGLEPVVLVPSTLGANAVYAEQLGRIRAATAAAGPKAYLAGLPAAGTTGGTNFYLMELKDFGLLMLFKKGGPYDQTVLHGINRLNLKLAQACRASLYADDLEKAVLERTRALRDLNAELLEVNAKLQESLDNVKTLSGLLPICANCKKIRDDQGYWNRIESYVRTHTHAQFTHSICPDCASKLYPGYAPKKPGERKKKRGA